MKDAIDLLVTSLNFLGLIFLSVGTWKMFLSTEPSKIWYPNKESVEFKFNPRVIYWILIGKIKMADEALSKLDLMLVTNLFNQAVRFIVLGILLQVLSAGTYLAYLLSTSLHVI